MEVFLVDALKNSQVGVASALRIRRRCAILAKIIETDHHARVIARAGGFDGFIKGFAGDEAACHPASGAVGGDPFGEAGTLGELEKRRTEHGV